MKTESDVNDSQITQDMQVPVGEISPRQMASLPSQDIQETHLNVYTQLAAKTSEVSSTQKREDSDALHSDAE